MNCKQSSAILAAIMTAASVSLAAAPKGDNPGKGHENGPAARIDGDVRAEHEGKGEEGKNDLRIHVRSDAEKKAHVRENGNSNQDNENSNRQSDDDSTRGLERAAERRSEQGAEHSNAGGEHDRDEHPWYDPRGWWPFD